MALPPAGQHPGVAPWPSTLLPRAHPSLWRGLARTGHRLSPERSTPRWRASLPTLSAYMGHACRGEASAVLVDCGEIDEKDSAGGDAGWYVRYPAPSPIADGFFPALDVWHLA